MSSFSIGQNISTTAVTKKVHNITTLEFLIAVGLPLLNFGEISTPYVLIWDPTLIRFCKIELNPMLIGNRK